MVIFCANLSKNISDLTQKAQNWKKKFSQFLGPYATPLGVPISQLIGNLSKIASVGPLI